MTITIDVIRHLFKLYIDLSLTPVWHISMLSVPLWIQPEIWSIVTSFYIPPINLRIEWNPHTQLKLMKTTRLGYQVSLLCCTMYTPILCNSSNNTGLENRNKYRPFNRKHHANAGEVPFKSSLYWPCDVTQVN